MNTFILTPKSYVLVFCLTLTSPQQVSSSYPRAGPLKVIRNFFVAGPADGKTVPAGRLVFFSSSVHIKWPRFYYCDTFLTFS